MKKIFWLICFVIMVAGVSNVSAATLTVCESGCDFTTIQAAHDAASINDIIDILATTQIEHSITISKDLTIQGQGQTSTTVSANQAGRVFTIAADVTVILQDMTIRDGKISSTPSYGGGIVNAGDLTVLRCTITENQAYSIGGSWNSEVYAYGGGIYSTGPLHLMDSEVITNIARGGFWDPFYPPKNADHTINTRLDQRNQSTYAEGGGIYSINHLTIENCSVTGNHALGCDCPVMDESTGFGASGGALYHLTGDLSIINSSFQDNLARGASNGEYYGADSNGGGIAAGNCQISFSFVNVTDNKSYGGNSGRVSDDFVGGQASGGGLYLYNCTCISTLSNVTVNNNRAISGWGECLAKLGDIGGGIYAQNCDLIIQDSTISGNSGGGGLWLSGTNQIVSSAITQNGVSGSTPNTFMPGCDWYMGGSGGPGQGGGIRAQGDLTVDNCTISLNSASGGSGECEYDGSNCGSGGYGQGGGLYHSYGQLIVIDSIISDNYAGGGGAQAGGYMGGLAGSGVGGGIYAAVGMTLSDSEVTGNTVSGGSVYENPSNYELGERCGDALGGGLYIEGTALIQDTNISSNAALGGTVLYDYLQLGVLGDGKGAGLYANGTLIMTGSTLSANTVTGGSKESEYEMDYTAGSGFGAGIYNADTLTVINSTITQNVLQGGTIICPECVLSVGGSGSGAGIYNNGTMSLIASTVSANDVQRGSGDDQNGIGYGGGLYNAATISINNIIAANNTSTDHGPDLYGSFTSEDHNLIRDTTDGTIIGTTTHNIYGQDPLLGPLQDNGGPTWTHALQDWSPAIDAGSCVISSQTTDQRGVARPHDDPSVTDSADGCDIGAFEWEGISASIKGHVYLQDQTDHSGTVVSVLYENVPTMTGMGLVLLLILLSLLIWRYHGQARSMYVLIVLFVIVVGVQAALSVITPSDGSYLLSPDEGGLFPPGQYTIVFEHEGYYTQSIPITIPAQETVFVMDDVTLLPIGGNAGSVYATDEIVGSLRYIPAGTCNQGSPGEEACRSSDETLFNHTLTRYIAVMETELTRQMWADLLAVQPSLPADPTDTAHGSELTNPVQNLTWFEAILYANLLSVQNGLNRCYYTDSDLSIPIDATNYTSGPFYCDFGANGYHLLSEGEWEYVTRAGTTGPFSCDESNYTADNCSSCVSGTHPGLEQYAVYCANDVDQSATVGSKLANPWNVRDLHGNVGEWCWDWSGDYPDDTTDYTGPASGSARVFRGGSWSTPASDCRSAARHSSGPTTRDYTLGVRLARSLSSGPLILNVTDPNVCTQSGISIAFSGAAGATRHDLWVDGVEGLIDVNSPCAYDPQDSLEHTYVIRAFIGSESFDTASVSFTDNPVVPVITGIIDEDACAASGIRVSYNASSLAMRHDLYDESGLLASSYVSDSLYLPGDTASHDYFIRTIYQGCYFDSEIVSGTDSDGTQDEPSLDPPSDPDPCAFGLTIVFTGGAGASSHDLWVDGVQAMTGISSPFTYQSSDTYSHEFMIRAIYGTCFKDSNVETASDTNNDPGTPAITAIDDLDACALTGVSITFSTGPEATSHDLWVNGSEVAVAIVSPYLYEPFDSNSHDYVVRAIKETCFVDSDITLGTDSNDQPGEPSLDPPSDPDPCAFGLTIVFTGGAGASSHDLWVDGVQAMTGISSPFTYQSTDVASHEFMIRAINGNCSSSSNSVVGSDVNNTPVPTIIGPSVNTCPDGSVTLSTESGMNNYQWYLDTALIVGATSDILVAIESGNYTVSYENVLGCSGCSIEHLVTIIDCPPYSGGDLYSFDNIVGNMRYIPAGTFTQGSPNKEPCRNSSETQFNHTLTRIIAVMETEVTRQMWADLLAMQPTLPADPTNTSYGSGMSNPAQKMSWYETVLFANLLSLQNGLTQCYYTDTSFTVPVDVTNYTTGPFYCDFDAQGYRLLSEGEWEYAARAGTTTPFSCDEPNYTSDNCESCIAGTHLILEQYAVYCANDNCQSEAVGSKLANPWNLKDMHGNVWELCWDWYSLFYPGDTTDYSGPVSGSYRVMRGGGWDYYYARNCRSANRGIRTPGLRNHCIGFRLARSVN